MSIGPLLAFVIVLCGPYRTARILKPSGRSARRCSVVALLGIGTCLLLMFSLPTESWPRLLIGLVIYFGWGRKHSLLRR